MDCGCPPRRILAREHGFGLKDDVLGHTAFFAPRAIGLIFNPFFA
jgi:hypothetical protein